MENSYILLVSNKTEGFMVNTIYEAVKKAGISVKNISASDSSIGEYIESSFGVFIVDGCENTYMMNTIRNKCYETDKKIILYGGPGELETMKRIFVDSMIFSEIVRPVEMYEVVEQIKKLQIRSKTQSIMKKVLVVDDNGVFLRTIKNWLGNKYLVSLANSASSALKLIQDKNVPDLILLDYEMPECSGAQFMEMLSSDAETSTIPVIFLTSRNDVETVREVMALKPKGYILKTTPQDDLLKRIEDFFDAVN